MCRTGWSNVDTRPIFGFQGKGHVVLERGSMRGSRRWCERVGGIEWYDVAIQRFGHYQARGCSSRSAIHLLCLLLPLFHLSFVYILRLSSKHCRCRYPSLQPCTLVDCSSCFFCRKSQKRGEKGGRWGSTRWSLVRVGAGGWGRSNVRDGSRNIPIWYWCLDWYRQARKASFVDHLGGFWTRHASGEITG